MKLKKINPLLFAPAFLFFLVTFYLFTLPGKDIPQVDWMEAIDMDKIVHVSLFVTIICLWCFPFKKSPMPAKKKIIWFSFIAVLGVCYGVSIEYIQKYFIVGRSFDLYDILADSIGCIIGYFLALKFLLKHGVMG
ncbi:VanZ family protein [Parasediminibacterium sp. JCM 36343]|uniref:VanZ family protein n=1 Tax=Parasediminibacterium sp. JCM 36343 TaxID=3374279 RepID=UPI00397CD162